MACKNVHDLIIKKSQYFFKVDYNPTMYIWQIQAYVWVMYMHTHRSKSAY